MRIPYSSAWRREADKRAVARALACIPFVRLRSVDHLPGVKLWTSEDLKITRNTFAALVRDARKERSGR